MDALFRQNTIDPKLIIQQLNELVRTYGAKFPDYDPDTLNVFVKKATGKELHPTVLEKLRAYYHILTNPEVYKHWHIFNFIANVLIDGVGVADRFNVPSLPELLLTCYIIQRDAKKMLKHVTDEVKTYVTTIWQKEYGLYWPHPVVLPFWNGPEIDDELAKCIVLFASNPNLKPVDTDPKDMQAWIIASLYDIIESFEVSGMEKRAAVAPPTRHRRGRIGGRISTSSTTSAATPPAPSEFAPVVSPVALWDSARWDEAYWE